MSRLAESRLVHLELRTRNAVDACVFYRRLFGWRAEAVHLGRESYVWLSLGGLIEGGVAEVDQAPPAWLPYVEVADVAATAARAELLGAGLVLAPREGPAGWRCVIASPDGTQVALWQPKLGGR